MYEPRQNISAFFKKMPSLEFKGEEYTLPNGLKCIRVSNLISYGEILFNPYAQSIKSSENINSPWYGVSPEIIRKKWNQITNAGTYFHAYCESNIYSVSVPLISRIHDTLRSTIGSDNFQIYTETRLFSEKLRVAGTADIIVYAPESKSFYIFDLKTNSSFNSQKIFKYFQQLMAYRLLFADMLESKDKFTVNIGGILRITNISKLLFESEKSGEIKEINKENAVLMYERYDSLIEILHIPFADQPEFTLAEVASNFIYKVKSYAQDLRRGE